MVTAVDWSRALQRGSYKGVRFQFDLDEREGGRRLVVHEFPGAEAPVVEDMGRRAVRYVIAAYVGTRGQANLLWNACTAPGAGILSSPTHGTVLARCEEIIESHERDRMGYLAFDLTFVVEGTGISTFSLPDAASFLFGLIERVFDVIPGTVRGALDTMASTPLLEDLATLAIRGNVERVRSRMQSVTISRPVARDVLAALDAGWIAARAPVRGTAPAYRAITGAMRALVTETETDVALVVARSLAAVPGLGREPLSHSRRLARRFAHAADLGVALAAVAVAMRQEALGPWPSRQDAVLACERIRALFDGIGESVGELLGEEAYRRLLALRNETIARLTLRLTDLAPIVAVDLGTSRSSIRVAFDLYGSPGQARAIIRRNDVATPALMPTRLEVVQP